MKTQTWLISDMTLRKIHKINNQIKQIRKMIRFMGRLGILKQI